MEVKIVFDGSKIKVYNTTTPKIIYGTIKEYNLATLSLHWLTLISHHPCQFLCTVMFNAHPLLLPPRHAAQIR